MKPLLMKNLPVVIIVIVIIGLPLFTSHYAGENKATGHVSQVRSGQMTGIFYEPGVKQTLRLPAPRQVILNMILDIVLILTRLLGLAI